ncbi:MAG TPA: ABC transporter ATP-binding protein [Patescibacteria group bacterium]|nr:ABC transporter ATP-binding protein [Patescibacteria group bacterium]
MRAAGLGFAYAGADAAALRDVDLDVPAGACLLVVGPSGSGKSTLGLAMAGLVPRDLPGTWTGSLTIDGLETRNHPPGALAARVGVVFQDPARQIVMDRVDDDVAFGLENRAWARPAMLRRVPEALAEAGMAGLERRIALDLSGGEQQRLALAGVLAVRPGVLVLDEPTANLDPVAARAFLERLGAIRAARVATIVLVEHRVEGAWPLADLVLALGRDGRPIAFGPPAAVLADRARLDAAGIWLPPDGPVQDPPPVSAAVTTGGPIVVASGVSFAYDPARAVLKDLDLQAGAGERIALVGANGSGKSTLGRLLVGLLVPTAGTVRLGGDQPARLPAASLARRAGYVFQDPERQFLGHRVGDEILLGLRPDETRAAADLLERLGLPLAEFGERSPYGLSGGEQRRLSLATVLIRRPDVLVLDEPTFGQDRIGYEALLAILDEHVADGTCLFAATHDERFVADVAGRTIRLESGAIASDEARP